MSYVFEPDVLHRIAKGSHGLPLQAAFEQIVREVDLAYPKQQIKKELHWIFNNACGAMGQLSILYASLSEYLLLFGTPIGTEGHSGRYLADVYDFMISGEMWTYYEGDLERSVFRPGDAAHLPFRTSKGYCVKESAWMLEYARGAIPTMLPTGLADNFFSNLDFKSVGAVVCDYGVLTVRELLKGKI